MIICDYALVLWALISILFIGSNITMAFVKAYQQASGQSQKFDTYMQDLAEAFENESVESESQIKVPLKVESPFLNMTLKQLKSRIKQSDDLASEVKNCLGKSYHKARKAELQSFLAQHSS